MPRRRGVRVEREEREEAWRIGGREERAGLATLLIASAHALRRLFATTICDPLSPILEAIALALLQDPGFEEAGEPQILPRRFSTRLYS